MGEDIELSCDEGVIKQLGNNIKKEYSSSLLSLSTGKRIIGGSPIAFGENNIKNRIKNILSYKKPTFWVVIVIIILITVIGIGLVTNPKDKVPDLSFLNPNNLSNLLVQNKNEFIKIANFDHEGFTKLPAYKISDWINDTEWKEKKVLTPNKLQPTYAILNIHSNDVNSEIRLYQSEPNLAMIVYNDKWRYYTINDESYNKFQLQVALSSFYEPFETTDNISMTDNRNEIILPDFKYNGDDEIMKLVYKTEIENYGYRREDGFLIPAVHIHGSYDEENKLKVFVTIYDNIYKLYGDKVKSISGGVTPKAITFTINDDGSYLFDKSERTRDGSEFPISIKEFCTYPSIG